MKSIKLLSVACLIVLIFSACPPNKEGNSNNDNNNSNKVNKNENDKGNKNDNGNNNNNTDQALLKRAQDLAQSGAPFPYNLAASYMPQLGSLWDPETADLAAVKLNFKTQLKDDAVDNIFTAVGNDRANPVFLAQKPALSFYESTKPGAAFANTYDAKVEFSYGSPSDQIKTKQAELIFQAEKFHLFNNESLKDAYDKVAQLRKNNNAKQFVIEIAKLTKNFSDTNWFKEWDKKSVAIMSQIHAARFKAEPELFLGLIATAADTVIVENSGVNDGLWGNGPKSRPNGIVDKKNQLGLLYMIHRQRFWYDFKNSNPKNPSKANFDAKNVDHIVFMLEWLAKYDGRVIQ